MAISGIPSSRVSDRYVRQRLLAQEQSNQAELLRLETQLSTGHSFEYPSEDPVAAQRVTTLQRLLQYTSQVDTNLATTQSYLSATDSALSAVSDVITSVKSDALSAIGTTATDTQRESVAEEVQQAITQLIDTANTQYRGRYLFAGSKTGVQPFQVLDGNVVSFQGNDSDVYTYGTSNLLIDTNVQADEAFGVVSDSVTGDVDLDPALTSDTRLADLNGGQGVSLGSISVSDGHNTSVIDLSSAETVGDVARLIRQNAPEGNSIDVEIGAKGLTLTLASGDLSVSEVGGTTAEDLGILTDASASGTTVVGDDLNPALTGSTRLSDVLGSRARAVFRSSGANNDVIVQSDHNGEDLNGVTISLVDDGSVTAGNERAVYDATAKTLTVYVEDDHTTGQQVADAINNAHDLDATAMPFTAGLDSLDAASSGAGTVSSSTTSSVVTHDGSGADFDSSSGLQIVNGLYSKTIDLSKAVTVEDVVNAVNGADIGVLARINDDGTAIDVRTTLSGADFSVAENGGTTATQLGIRTFNLDTELDSLNYGSGVACAGEGVADFTITRSDGYSFEVSVYGDKTIGDVIDAINANLDADGKVAVTARLAASGNGIELVDTSGGTGALTITCANGSDAAIDLGLVQSGQDSSSSSTSGAAPNILTGSDVNPQETKGLFTALVRLQEGLLNNDNGEIERAMAMLENASTDLTFSRAELGARQNALDALQTQLDTQNIQLQSDLSDNYDVDIAQVLSDLVARQIALQASLKAMAITTQLTLLDYL